MHRTSRSSVIRILLISTVAAAAVALPVFAPTAGWALPGPTVPPTTGMVTADALPTAQIDGVAWTQLIVGNTVYVGGDFTRARPAGAAPGMNTVVRNNLLAYELTTGALLPFAPSVNGQVKALAASPDGKRLYIGGSFTSVGGSSRARIAAFDLSLGGQLASGFGAGTDSRVEAIAATATTVYVGGAFNSANGQSRARLAAFRADTGALTTWNPGADAQVRGLVVTPDGARVVAGGAFTTLAGAAAYGMGAVDATTGAARPWAATNVIRNAGPNAAILGLATNGDKIFGWGYKFGSGGNFEGAFSADPGTGAIHWVQDCHGDTYGAYATASTVYTVGHAHFCGNVGGFPQTTPWSFNRAIAFTTQPTGTLGRDIMGYQNFEGQPSPSLINWFPELDPGTVTGQTQAAWTITGNGDYVVAAGEFPRVNGQPQQGLVRFAIRPIAPGDRGPQVSGAAFAPSVVGLARGRLRVAFPTNWDMDHRELTYRIVRQGAPPTTIYPETVHSSTFWNRPAVAVVDDGLVPGQSYQYRVYARDADGNEVASNWVTANAPTGTAHPYASRVLLDGATTYWRLNEASGTTAQDLAGFAAGSAGSGVTWGTAGAIAADTAATFSGGSTGVVSAVTNTAASNTFTVEAWFRTSSTRGGKIIGFGSNVSGSSGNYDRHVYLDNSGRVHFGVYPGAVRAVNSSRSYNDNAWHHVVASLGPNGMRLYVDGAQVAQRTDTTGGQAFGGHWRVGGDNLAGWPSAPTSGYLAGQIDDVAIYSAVLDPGAVTAHHQLGIGATPGNTAPTAAFTATLNGSTVAVDGRPSTDPDGTIASHSFDFGDGSPAVSGATATHTYAAPGTYRITLTVTDNAGATGTAQRDVTVAGNAPPIATFSWTTNGLVAAFDAGGSSDPDGSIAGYAWTFGDGGTGTGATPTRQYQSAGTYPVTLTVTDDDGVASQLTRQVTVSPAGTPPAIARDDFARTVAGGLGAADVGGTWTLASPPTTFAVDGARAGLRLNPGATAAAALLAATGGDVSLRATVAIDKPATGGGAFSYLSVREQPNNTEYRARVKFVPTGAIQLSLGRTVVRGGDHPVDRHGARDQLHRWGPAAGAVRRHRQQPHHAEREGVARCRRGTHGVGGHRRRRDRGAAGNGRRRRDGVPVFSGEQRPGDRVVRRAAGRRGTAAVRRGAPTRASLCYFS